MIEKDFVERETVQTKSVIAIVLNNEMSNVIHFNDGAFRFFSSETLENSTDFKRMLNRYPFIKFIQKEDKESEIEGYVYLNIENYCVSNLMVSVFDYEDGFVRVVFEIDGNEYKTVIENKTFNTIRRFYNLFNNGDVVN